jgi:hypothetical protein
VDLYKNGTGAESCPISVTDMGDVEMRVNDDISIILEGEGFSREGTTFILEI